ncbi:acetyltransferase, GNAT family [Bifidobacterium cuniculi]|uniref:Acetyltransferase, GNAT family n=1 Tax=Bifidobacterium cuniculi TaxID=1688 RepID=A0A087AL32_9BIFI|nr:acetyltransferase, GNAT family [Bifidobacterium cuniculi]
MVGSLGCVMADSGDAVLHRLYVKPQCKRQGIGSDLLLQAEKYARARGCARVLAHLGDPTTYWESRLFYPHHGYVFLDDNRVGKMLDTHLP